MWWRWQDWVEGWRIVRDNAVRDPVNGAVLPLMGAAFLFWVWYRGWIPFDVIHELVCHDLC